MTTRTFRQHAQGFGAATTNITVTLNGQEIFSGPVATENAPLPVLPDPAVVIDNVIFTWENDTTFSGPATLEISVSGSPLLLADTVANYPTDAPEFSDQYLGFYSYQDSDVTVTDPFANEQIDGIPVARVEGSDLTGQWWWTIMPGSTFTATVNIAASLPPPTE
jgi:hypothetical protein